MVDARGALLAVVAVAGCGAEVPSAAELAAAAPPGPARVGVLLPPGESLLYQVSAGPFDGGTVALAAEPAADAGIALVRARIATRGLAALLDDRQLEDRTWIRLATGRPLRFRSRMTAGDARSVVDAVFHPRGAAAIELVQRSGAGVVRTRQGVPGRAALNLHSALYALRAWSLVPARPATLDVLARSRLWRVTVRQGGPQVIATESGAARVIRLDGIAWRTRADGSPDAATGARRFRLFFSADPRRRPLRLEVEARFGVVRAELVPR